MAGPIAGSRKAKTVSGVGPLSGARKAPASGGGIDLPINISDVTGLTTALNKKVDKPLPDTPPTWSTEGW